MTAATATTPFPARLKTPVQLDPVLLTIVLTLLLGGLVILDSTDDDNDTGQGVHVLFQPPR